jgi:hypothetical protein
MKQLAGIPPGILVPGFSQSQLLIISKMWEDGCLLRQQCPEKCPPNEDLFALVRIQCKVCISKLVKV